MKQKSVIIIGAGLSGILLAYRLEKRGYNCTILEARNRIGGRIHTLQSELNTPIELGATWLGEQHVELMNLLRELQLETFPQFMEGTSYFQAFSTAPAQPIELPAQAPSYRIKGGTSALINALANKLNTSIIHLQEGVKQLEAYEDYLLVHTAANSFKSDYVAVCLPPRLIARKIEFVPPLPLNTREVMEHTHTWMRDSIKLAVVYEQPFWRAQHCSGTLFSNVGPIQEFYDHTDATKQHFALCGFVSGGYSALSIEALKEKVINQLVGIFGDLASNFIKIETTDWSTEEYTATALEAPLFPHQNNGHPELLESRFNNRLFICGAETASQFSGYMEGAIRSVQRVLSHFD